MTHNPLVGYGDTRSTVVLTLKQYNETLDKIHRRNMQIADLKKQGVKGYRIVHYGDDYIAVSNAKDVFKGKVHEITGEARQILEAILPVDIKY